VICKNCGLDNPEKARFCANCGATLVTPWAPGVGSSYSNAWRQLWKHFLVLLLIGIVYGLISSVSWVFRFAAVGLSPILSLAYSILLPNPLGYGVAFAYLKAARGDPVKVKDMFEVFHNYWNVVLASLLVGVIVAIGLVLLIIPGIIFACKLAFTPYLVVDRKMAIIEAVKESWRMTGGYSWKVFLIGLLAIPICIAGLICFGVGIIIAIMWITLAFASLYHAVSKLSEASPQQGLPVT
jgi:uncharacterized membrane protein